MGLDLSVAASRSFVTRRRSSGRLHRDRLQVLAAGVGLGTQTDVLGSTAEVRGQASPSGCGAVRTAGMRRSVGVKARPTRRVLPSA